MPLESQLLPKIHLFRNWKVSMSYKDSRGKDGLRLRPLLREGALSMDKPLGGFLY